MDRAEIFSSRIEPGTPAGAEGARVRHGTEYDSWAAVVAMVDAGIGGNVVCDRAFLPRSHAFLWRRRARDSRVATADPDVFQHDGIDGAVAGSGRWIADRNDRHTVECV